MRRRTLLRHVGLGAGAVVLAGCLDETETDGSDGDNDGTDDDSTEDSDDRSTRIVSESIDSESGCATGEEAASEATVVIEDETITITGSLEAPNPCHDAVVESAEMVDGELAVTVDIDPHDVEVCQECLARIDYEAAIEFEGEPPETVTVSHAEIAGEDQLVEEVDGDDVVEGEPDE